MGTKEDLKAYLRKPAHFRRIILAIPMLIFGIGLLPKALESAEKLLLIFMCLIIGTALILSRKITTKEDRKQLDSLLDQMEQDGTLLPVLQDFDTAQHFFGRREKLRLGKIYIFIRGANKVFCYQDVYRIFGSGYEDYDYFTIEMKNADHPLQCEYYDNSQSDLDDIQKAISTMIQHNPSILVDRGYFSTSVW